MNHRALKIINRMGIALLAVVVVVVILGKMAGFGCAGADNAIVENPQSPATTPSASGTTDPDRMLGYWLGTWASSKSDMGGKLECRVEQIAEDRYRARFDAVFAKVFTNTSIITLRVHEKGSKWKFTGKEDLGFLKGGVYSYQGQSDGAEFVCTYDSSMDNGTFHLKRQAAATAPVGR